MVCTAERDAVPQCHRKSECAGQQRMLLHPLRPALAFLQATEPHGIFAACITNQTAYRMYITGKSRCDLFCMLIAARLNLPIKWLPDRIAEQNFNLEEPPTKASAWVGALLNNHLKVFRERLSTMPMLSPADVDQVWVAWIP